jgi:hypothetical protein
MKVYFYRLKKKYYAITEHGWWPVDVNWEKK